LAAFGNTLLLQVKRIDVETQATLSVGSVKCALGKEDELASGAARAGPEGSGKTMIKGHGETRAAKGIYPVAETIILDEFNHRLLSLGMRALMGR